MTNASVNIHYHGTNTPPVCHQDEVITTVVNSGESFDYDVHFPTDEPPGLYWYHPHIHGISEGAVLGGASGAIVVGGIENVNPAVAGLPQRILLIRDNNVPGNPQPGGMTPSWDISLNYIPVPYPDFTPAVIPMKPLAKQFWRVVNASADTILNLQLQYDGVAQPLTVVALDGVPTGSQDGTSKGKSIVETNVFLAPAARAEFIVTAPPASVKNATFLTLNVPTGPDGDNDPQRPVAAIEVSPNAADPALTTPAVSGPPVPARFAGLASAVPSVTRHLYFSEVLSDPDDPNSPTNFFITVDGQTPVLFSPTNPPAITTTRGSVEDWIIENRALENHEFHIHQIHFLLLEENGAPVPNGQYLDTMQVPYWSGTGPYPSIKVRMDFRGPVVGDFVYHCHILGHEDAGMMAIIRVLPK
jgi:FtsP/CotA-like multicopper oxidase with cupredoxin domain